MAVDKLVDSAQLNSDLTAVADAIRAKTGGTADLQFPAEFVSEIESIPSGGGSEKAPYNDVEFIDYDGFRLYSYSKADFLQLESMPPNPSHEGLTAQGWNWSLEDAKAYVRKYGEHVIGQLYITDDGKTRLYFEVTYAPQTVTINFTKLTTSTYTVNWGDGTVETISGNGTSMSHEYAAIGTYMCAISVNGTLKFAGTNNTNGMITQRYVLDKIELGNNASFDPHSLAYQYKLKTITCRSDVASPTKALTECKEIRAFVCAKNGLSYAFSSPQLEIVSFAKTGSATFTASCDRATSLRRLVFPDNITNFDSNGPRSCSCIRKINIPENVTNLYQNVFNGFSNCKEFHFYPTTPPTRGGSGVFCAADAIIYVPYSADHSILNDYKTTTNWTTLASYIQEEPQ